MSKKETDNKKELFEKTFQRPKNFFNLPVEKMLAIDKKLGLVDWSGWFDLTDKEKQRFRDHYDKSETPVKKGKKK